MSDNSIPSDYPLDSGRVVSADDDDGEMDELVAAYDRATDEDYIKFEEAVGLIELRAALTNASKELEACHEIMRQVRRLAGNEHGMTLDVVRDALSQAQATKEREREDQVNIALGIVRYARKHLLSIDFSAYDAFVKLEEVLSPTAAPGNETDRP